MEGVSSLLGALALVGLPMVALAVPAAWLAVQKGRPVLEGALLGALVPIVGLAAEALLPPHAEHRRQLSVFAGAFACSLLVVAVWTMMLRFAATHPVLVRSCVAHQNTAGNSRCP